VREQTDPAVAAELCAVAFEAGILTLGLVFGRGVTLGGRDGASDAPGRPLLPPPTEQAFGGSVSGAVGEAVNDGLGQAGVEEDPRPLAEGQVGGDDQRAAFVAFGEDLEDELGGAVGEGEVAELVEDQ